VASVAEGLARVVLPGGHQLTCPAASDAGGLHHLSIRPERVSLVASGGDLDVTVERVVYLGTDLQLLTRLDGGAEMHVRIQNSARIAVPSVGTRVGLRIEDGAARLLAD